MSETTQASTAEPTAPAPVSEVTSASTPPPREQAAATADRDPAIDRESETGTREPKATPSGRSAAPVIAGDAPEEVRRLLRLRVPVITQLASRQMPIGTIRKLSIGTILEFDKSIDQPLKLLVNNQCVGKGDAVRVGERFGLLINHIEDRAARIRCLGG
ncbi:MAG: FliM/FliN family flagellar motor switch protein [Phycisphaerae bacterium]|jgi:flagellar motor switch protein FliN/FliY|nr:FliM/FliN family flagellar motor switch protein [Phycisphaerae bacterium]MCZ2400841.1 FliM/FliN family flagellar motor switch protein [Phycisphaerae bacterium]